MKILKVIIALTIATLLISGCTVPSHFEKSIAVTKDASGKIISTTTTEKVVQPNLVGYPVKFELLNGVQPKKAPMAEE
jgi:hypothetical protein